ncbi:MAG: hypothetical protein ACTSWA_12765 [Candidatus Thorarchaeota archaeon]
MANETVVPLEFIHQFHQKMQFSSNADFDKWCKVRNLDAGWIRKLEPSASISLLNVTYKVLDFLNKPESEDLFWATVEEIIRLCGGITSEVDSLLKNQGKEWRDGRLSPINPVMLNPLEKMDALEKLHQELGLSQDYIRQIREAYKDYTINSDPNGALGKYRTALEKLLAEFAQYAQEKHPDSSRYSLDISKPYSVRNFLKDIGFLHEKEHEMIKGFYGWISSHGSHEFSWETSDASVDFVMVILPAWIRVFSERYKEFRVKYS